MGEPYSRNCVALYSAEFSGHTRLPGFGSPQVSLWSGPEDLSPAALEAHTVGRESSARPQERITPWTSHPSPRRPYPARETEGHGVWEPLTHDESEARAEGTSVACSRGVRGGASDWARGRK